MRRPRVPWLCVGGCVRDCMCVSECCENHSTQYTLEPNTQDTWVKTHRYGLKWAPVCFQRCVLLGLRCIPGSVLFHIICANSLAANKHILSPIHSHTWDATFAPFGCPMAPKIKRKTVHNPRLKLFWRPLDATSTFRDPIFAPFGCRRAPRAQSKTSPN